MKLSEGKGLGVMVSIRGESLMFCANMDVDTVINEVEID